MGRVLDHEPLGLGWFSLPPALGHLEQTMKRFYPPSKNGPGSRWVGQGLSGLMALLFLLLAVVAFGGEPPATAKEDQALIRQCLELARASVAKGNEPFGALLKKDGRIVMRAENTINGDDNVTHHAETNLLAAVYRQHGSQGAHGATLYTSSEPCPMCCGAIYLMGVSRVVYGLSTERLAAMSGFRDAIRAKAFFALAERKIEVTGPVLEDQAAQVMAQYLKTHPLTHHRPAAKAPFSGSKAER